VKGQQGAIWAEESGPDPSESGPVSTGPGWFGFAAALQTTTVSRDRAGRETRKGRRRRLEALGQWAAARYGPWEAVGFGSRGPREKQAGNKGGKGG